jgi:tellurite resistance protein
VKKTAKKTAKKATKRAASKKKATKTTASKKKATKRAASNKAASKKTVKAKQGRAKGPAQKKVAKRGAESKGLGDTLLRALTVAMVSDGEIAPAEQAILHRFAKESVFRGIDAGAVIESTIQRCLDQGSEATLDEITRRLKTKQDRETAFTSCLAVAATDGKLTPSEIRMLHGLRDALEISDARARQLAGPAAPIFR